MRGYGKDGVVDAIREAGGEIYAVTSEPQSLAHSAQEDWQTGFEHVGDPHQEIAGMCAQRGWLSLFTNDWDGDIVESSWISHPKGYFQPGVLALSRERRVLYRWRCRPSRKNIGGAVARPTPTHVWSRVQAALQDADGAPDVAPDPDPELDSRPAPWPLFVMLLLANGWFLRPVAFDQRPGSDTVQERIRNAALRVGLFVAVWIVAGVLLPWWVVSLGFAGWLLKVLPGIQMVQRRFQSVGPREEPA